MRVKEFDDKIHANKVFIWFTHNLFPKTISGTGQKAEAYDKLLKLCRTAYNLNSGGPLVANEPPAPPPVEEVHGQEGSSDSGEGAGDPT